MPTSPWYESACASLVAAVDTALSTLQHQPHRVKQLMGTCLDKLVPMERASAA